MKYPKYKESGIQWLGEIPEHWEVKKARHIGDFSGSTVDKKSNDNERVVRIVNFVDVFNNSKFIIEEMNFMKVTAKDYQLSTFNLIVGDMVFTPSSEDKNDIGRSALIKYTAEDLLYSYHLIRLRFLIKIDNNFKKYLFNNKRIFNYFSSECTGSTRKILTREKFKNIPIALPPLSEQTQIANFLDYKLEKINRFIKKKKQLIKLLQEQKQATINQAVTKGLDKNVELKDSGIEWLGQIPVHWEVKRLKYYVSFNDETLSNNTNKDYQLKYIDIGNVDNKGNIKEIVDYKFEDAPSRARRIVKSGDVIVSTVRTYLKAIAKIIDDKDIIVSTGFIVLRPKVDLISTFLNYAVRADYFIENICSNSFGVSYPAINPTQLVNLRMAVPPKNEQESISQFIETETQKIEKTISTIKKELDLVEEYKTALIAEAVTGKINVSNLDF